MGFYDPSGRAGRRRSLSNREIRHIIGVVVGPPTWIETFAVWCFRVTSVTKNGYCIDRAFSELCLEA